LLPGCDQLKQKQKEYKKKWTETMSAFEERVKKDDDKANGLGEKNDVVGLINLANERIKYVDSTYDKIADYYPPAELRKLHAVTLFYLTSIVEQLKANSDLYDALRTGKPANDLKAIADDAAKQTAAIRYELTLEMDKAGLKLESEKKKQPQSSVPSSVPSSDTP
jgi:Zn-dependent oligopeptidase